jgi:hypothetical protein
MATVLVNADRFPQSRLLLILFFRALKALRLMAARHFHQFPCQREFASWILSHSRVPIYGQFSLATGNPLIKVNENFILDFQRSARGSSDPEEDHDFEHRFV